MTIVGWAQIALILAAVIAAAIPLGGYIARVLAGERTFWTPVLAPVERAFYRLSGVDPAREQSWLTYTMAMLAFSIVGFASLYALQRLQNFLPLNPQGFDGVPADLSFNTSLSFITNTNWQNYSGETTMSHLTQMLGLTVHNFLSAATGLAMAFALVRGFSRAESPTVGNFWVDVTRSTLYVLLPLSIVVALFIVTYPELGAMNVMKLASPQSAILSAVIFNALIIIALIPLALKGVPYRPVGAAALLRRNLLIYGLGGIVAPFIGIKLIDLLVSALHLA